MKVRTTLFLLLLCFFAMAQSNTRIRSLGITPGVMLTGPMNSITDVPDVAVGHTTKIEGDYIRTGVTAIIPHPGNIFLEKVPAAIFVGNGFGKLAGSTQVEELGLIESPIILTNTLAVGTAINAVLKYLMNLPDMEKVRSINVVVGETNDGTLNDIRGMHLTEKDVIQAIENASNGPVQEGNVGAGTGTIAFGFKGGIGSSSRVLPAKMGGYTVGVLVQANFGGVLQVDGIPIGKILNHHPMQNAYRDVDGSCMMVVATDAPLDARNLKRLAKRAMLGLARTGGIASNGSGDYVIAFSTAKQTRIPYRNEDFLLPAVQYLSNDRMSPLFLAAIEATEEAIYNALFAAETMTGNEHTIPAFPLDSLIPYIKTYR